MSANQSFSFSVSFIPPSKSSVSWRWMTNKANKRRGAEREAVGRAGLLVLILPSKTARGQLKQTALFIGRLHSSAQTPCLSATLFWYTSAPDQSQANNWLLPSLYLTSCCYFWDALHFHHTRGCCWTCTGHVVQWSGRKLWSVCLWMWVCERENKKAIACLCASSILHKEISCRIFPLSFINWDTKCCLMNRCVC